jgi:hypothetical protein
LTAWDWDQAERGDQRLRMPGLWLFRTNQRRADRRAYVMKLKMGERLVISGARLQCAQYRGAVDELVDRALLDEGSPVELFYGDGDPVLRHL